MQINNKQLKEYQILYKKLYRKEISPEEARKQVHSLLCLIKEVYKPIKK